MPVGWATGYTCRASAGMLLQHAADDRVARGVCEPVSTDTRARQIDHPHGHEGQEDVEAWTTGHRAKSATSACQPSGSKRAAHRKFMETTKGLASQ